MKRLVLIALLVLAMAPRVSAAGDPLSVWLSKNEPKVIAYLQSLDTSPVGNKLPGVMLSDGNRELEGYIYAGHVAHPPKGAHIYLFKYEGADVAYIWVDVDGNPLPLPPCSEDDPRTSLAGWGGAVLSGDVYSDFEVQPGGNLIITHCMLPAWLRGAE